MLNYTLFFAISFPAFSQTHTGGDADNIKLLSGSYEFVSTAGTAPSQASLRIDTRGNLRMDVMQSSGSTYTVIAKVLSVGNQGYLADKRGDLILIGIQADTYVDGRKVYSGDGAYSAIWKGGKLNDFEVNGYVFRGNGRVAGRFSGAEPELNGPIVEGNDRERRSSKIDPKGIVASALAMKKLALELQPLDPNRKDPCTKFVERVLDNAGIELTKAEKRRLHIAGLAEGDIPEALEENNPATRGGPGMLIDKGIAYEVSADEAQPGDIIQYWYKDDKAITGFSGHTGVVRVHRGYGKIEIIDSNVKRGASGQTVYTPTMLRITIARLK